MPIDDYLSAGPLIIQRLRTRVPDLIDIVPARTEADLMTTTLRLPAAGVVYMGDIPGDTSVRGASQAVDQKWMVVLVLSSAVQGDGAAALMAQAGPLMLRALSALSGYSLSDHHRPLQRIPGPRHGYQSSRAFFPLQFKCQVFTLAAP